MIMVTIENLSRACHFASVYVAISLLKLSQVQGKTQSVSLLKRVIMLLAYTINNK